MRLDRPLHRLGNHQPSKIYEGLEAGDLARLVHDELHIDEYKSKMGNDEDIIVVSFKVGGKDPATDLVNFIEKGYDWAIDADTSAGEMDDGDYVVFLEIERTPAAVEQILELLTDLQELTDNKLSAWRIKYHKKSEVHEATEDSLHRCIPTSPMDYIRLVGKDKDALNQLKAAAGIKIKDKAPDNDFTESIRVAAGIR